MGEQVLTYRFTVRQEKLLQGLMKEIVRLTTQKRPLEVGLPLYPFSHTTLFASPTVPLDDTPMAPLPNPSSLGQSDGLAYNSAFEMYSRSAAFPTDPSHSYCISSTTNDMYTESDRAMAQYGVAQDDLLSFRLH